jgi:hypothetical protein
MAGNFLFIHINEWGEFRSPDTIPISQAYQLACFQAHGFSGRILGDYRDRPLCPAVFRETKVGTCLERLDDLLRHQVRALAGPAARGPA